MTTPNTNTNTKLAAKDCNTIKKIIDNQFKIGFFSVQCNIDDKQMRKLKLQLQYKEDFELNDLNDLFKIIFEYSKIITDVDTIDDLIKINKRIIKKKQTLN